MEKQFSSMVSEKEILSFLKTSDIKKLIKLKNKLDNAYYNTGKSKMEDWKYDLLKDYIIEKHPEIKNQIGCDVKNDLQRVSLPYWLGSMDKISLQENQNIDSVSRKLKNWLNKNTHDEYIIEDKLDGVSCLLTKNKSGVKLFTRGNGKIGTDISHLYNYINNLPEKIKDDIDIRGELIIPKEIFENKYKDEYCNPRNMVSGLINNKTIKSELKDVKFIAYSMMSDELLPSPKQQLEIMKRNEFEVVNHSFIQSLSVDTLISALSEFQKNSIFDIDGIVIQPTKPHMLNKKDNPKYAIAFKMRFPENMVETKVVRVEWNPSKWGFLKPRIEIEPVMLSGIKITYTTGFNGKIHKR